MAFAFHILGTSSSGNCSLLEAGGTRMMLDAGFQGPRLEASLQKLGIEARALDAVFITHEHADHCVGLPALLRQNPMLKVFANRETARRIKDSFKSQPDWQLFETGTTFEFRGIQITSIPIPHDAADPVGFAFDLPAEDARPAKNQPFYHLLAENDQSYYVAYVSEQNLVPDETGEPVGHPDLGDLFGDFENGRYPLQFQLN